jgi:hypothetical protein
VEVTALREVRLDSFASGERTLLKNDFEKLNSLDGCSTILVASNEAVIFIAAFMFLNQRKPLLGAEKLRIPQ